MSYHISNNEYYPTADNAFTEQLPPGFYTVMFSEQRGFYLKSIEPFTTVKKIYGKSLEYSQRILDTFNRREGIVTSAAFTGVKGSGKTLLTKDICLKGVAEGKVVLVVNTPFSGDAFNTFIQNVTQSKIVVFDEFEKTYHRPQDRNGVLTLLDGTYQSHSLFILTMNTALTADKDLEFFANRPGRVYFNIQFAPIDLEALVEYCQDNLNQLDKLENIKSFINQFQIFTLDMLSVLVTEINLNPDLSLADISNYLNIKPISSIDTTAFDITLHKNNVDVTVATKSYLSKYALKDFLKRKLWHIMYDATEFEKPAKGVAPDGSSVVLTDSFVFDFDNTAHVIQNPVTRVTTITQGEYQLCIVPKYVEYFEQQQKIIF